MKKINLKRYPVMVVFWLLATLLLAACGDNTATSPKEAFPTPITNPTAGVIPAGSPGPVPGTVLKFPEDEAPHDVITEWWYYTGRLKTADGSQYGIEYVIFQGIRASFPVAYASHFAVSDTRKTSFKYDQRLSISQNWKAGGLDGFNLKVTAPDQPDWTMRGVNGTDNLKAVMADNSYAIDITVKDVKGISLHGGGQFSYGPAGSSYYYSRTRMEPSGSITVGGVTKQVTGGSIWFDKQWGNFLPLAGGWDWFSTQLDDGSELMFYNLRDKNNNLIQIFGTYIPACGNNCTPNKPLKSYDIDVSDISMVANGSWKSPISGITWPSGWTITVKEKPGIPAMTLTYKPVMPDQELDTRKTTAVIYWEGDTEVNGTKDGKPVSGHGYVELTGYDIGPVSQR